MNSPTVVPASSSLPPTVGVIDDASPFTNFVRRHFWSRINNEPLVAAASSSNFSPYSMFMRNRQFMSDRSFNDIQRPPSSDHDWYQDHRHNKESRDHNRQTNGRSDHNFNRMNDNNDDDEDGYDRNAAQMYNPLVPTWAESMNGMNSMAPIIPWHQFDQRQLFSSPSDNPNGFQPMIPLFPNMNYPLLTNRLPIPMPMPMFDDYDDPFNGETMFGQASEINEQDFYPNDNHNNGTNNIIYVVNIDGRKGNNNKNNVRAIRLNDYLARKNHYQRQQLRKRL
ncbi:hypothetical protein BLA29_007116 [Euroglyphus maynei]|uniref:Uncharacterized protein n=1 Tax=Euroglyphus maynei TaxID=6958 RepID=A0A1Y3AVL0_EURMA|nr:hypothetical protein BLA29_007116 [Euroglyphus maynei]